MNKRFEVIFTGDFSDCSGEIITTKLQGEIELDDDSYPSWEQVEQKILMPHFGYDVAEWEQVLCFHGVACSSFIVKHRRDVEVLGTCLIREVF